MINVLIGVCMNILVWLCGYAITYWLFNTVKDVYENLNNDFVKDNDFSGKDVIPFCTSMSDGIGDSGVHLAEMAGTGNWLEGMRFSENYDTSEVVEWAVSLNLQ